MTLATEGARRFPSLWRTQNYVVTGYQIAAVGSSLNISAEISLFEDNAECGAMAAFYYNSFNGNRIRYSIWRRNNDDQLSK